MRETATHKTSPSRSQGKWPGNLNIPPDTLPWVPHSHNPRNSCGSLRGISSSWVYLSRTCQLPQTSSHAPATGPLLPPQSSTPHGQVSEHERGLVLVRTALPNCQMTSVSPQPSLASFSCTLNGLLSEEILRQHVMCFKQCLAINMCSFIM